MMADREIEIMASLFAAQEPKSVLEFGSGHSTGYWPGRLPYLLKWVAIEHSAGWVKALEGKLAGQVELRLVERAEYYAPLLVEGAMFDFILVDGLYRCSCMMAGSLMLAPGGILVLHDSGRPEYLPAWGMFPHHEVLCPGELPRPGGKGFLHRGLAVFWRDDDVETKDWCRDYIVR